MEKELSVTNPFLILCASLLILAWLLLLPRQAMAHRPLFAYSAADRPEDAVRISDPSISHVLYFELTADQPHQWFTFRTDGSVELPVLLGLPKGLGQDDFQPVLLLLGPGLPGTSEELPFPSPQGDEVGIVALEAAQSPKSFYEPITGTDSHILVDSQVQIPESGTYYGVVYDAGKKGGKLWINVGQREGWTWRDVARLPGWIRQVRDFHEVSGWPRWAWIGLLAILAIVLGVGAWVRRRSASF